MIKCDAPHRSVRLSLFEYRPCSLPPAIMAIIWKSRGTVGPGSLDAGTSMPLAAIDTCLGDFRVFWHGERPKTMLPQSREYYIHVMIEVTDDDLQPQLERFSRPGFYQVVGLRVANAGFLFEFKPCNGPKFIDTKWPKQS